MRKTFTLQSLIAFAGISVLWGCSDDELRPFGESPGESQPMKIQAGIDQDMSTRADDNGFANGDRIGVFVVNYEGGVPGTLTESGNQADNVMFTFDRDMNHWNTLTPVYWKDSKTLADVIGYYPYDIRMGSVSDYAFEVSSDQSARPEGEMSTYEASDFLWGKAKAASPGEAVNIAFRHRMAGVMVILEAGQGFTGGEWEKLPKQVTVDNTVRQAAVDLSTGEVKAAGTYDRNITTSPGEGGVFRAVVVPQTVEAGKTVLGITIDGRSYHYTRESAMSYAGGSLHRFTMRVDKRPEEGKYSVTLKSEDIVPWISDEYSHDFEANSYFVVDCPAGGQLKASIEAAGSDPATVKNLKVSGMMDETDCTFIREGMPQLAALNIKDVKFPDNKLPDHAFYHNETIRRYILPDGITKIGNEAFRESRPTSTIVIPETVTVIGRWAFGYIWDEASLVLPGHLERIEDLAFYDTNIRFEMKLPPTLKYIGNEAFHRARNAYGSFSIPQGLEYLAGNAFHDCGNGLVGDVVIPPGLVTSLCFEMNFANGTNITIPEGVKRIERLAGRFNNRVVLPKTLERIEKQAFYCTRFATPIELPENIVYIGPGAFLESNMQGRLVIPPLLETVEEGAFNNTQLSEVIVGNNVLRIESGAFGRNPELRYMEIGKNVDYIGPDAIDGSWNLETLVCLAKEPPTAGNAFKNLYFDKTILEVPVGCVEKYRRAPGWRQFSNITEHRELAFNINEIECLDRGVTREGILRSEGAWRVMETPSWVHVSPMSGKAKEELTVTVDRQAAGSPTREGTIVFSLDGSGYTAKLPVRQLSASEAEDVEIVLQTASAQGNEIPIFIVGEGFNASDIVSGEYMRRMRETMEQFFDIEPYRSLRSHFTVTTAPACSPERGTSEWVYVKATCFGAEGVAPDEGKVRRYVERVSSHAGRNMGKALVIVVANHPVFAGWSNIAEDGCSFASVGVVDAPYPYDQRGLVQHFAGGEAFAGLGNENVTHFEHIRSCKCPGCNAIHRFGEMKQRGFFANLTMSPSMSDAPWSQFIFHNNYSATNDMWEGGYNHLRGVWRSESQSVMGTFIAYYNAISRYTIYKEVMRRAGLPASLEDFIATDKTETK